MLKAILLVGLALTANAQSDPTKTATLDNGLAWQTWNLDEKLGFTRGYNHALFALAGTYKIDANTYEPVGARMGDIIVLIDTFYSTR